MTVIFTEDFDDWASDWDKGDGIPVGSGWDELSACHYDDTFGWNMKIGSGRNGGQALYCYFNSSVTSNPYTNLNSYISGSALKEFYHRWYMKWPSALDKTATTAKLWRYNVVGGSAQDVDMNVYGGEPKLSDMKIAVTSIGVTTWFTMTGTDASGWMDGDWHCHEIRCKLESDHDAGDGALEYWLDGVKVYTNTSMNYCYWDHPTWQSDWVWKQIGVGLGNHDGSTWPWDNADWLAIQFDDIVVSTGYVGPESEGNGTEYGPKRIYMKGQNIS